MDELQKKMQDYKDREFKYESHLEDFFCRKVKEAGGWAVKFNPVAVSGLPDQLVFFKGFTWLIELKTLRGVVSERQKVIHKRFAGYGFRVRVVRTKEQVAEFIEDMLNLNS